MNTKNIGEIGVNSVIGVLSRFGLGIAFPLSDNYPFDLIVIAGKKLFKIQVKTSSFSTSENSICFDFSSSNWYKGTVKLYNENDCDFIIGFDIVKNKVFIFDPKQFSNRRSLTIRYEKDRKNSNACSDYEISEEIVKKYFELEEIPKLEVSMRESKEYDYKCVVCNNAFISIKRKAKYCSPKCKSVLSRKVNRPDKESLEKMVWEKPLEHLAKDFGITSNSIRKWCRGYGISFPTRGYWNKLYAKTYS